MKEKRFIPRGKYYLSLSVHNNGIGYACTDENYKVYEAARHPLIGSYLFDPAESAADRRLHRTTRRNLGRKAGRINFLNQKFEDAINAVDPLFFKRLSESFYKEEDRSEENKQKNTLFNDDSYKDADYKKEYPTIFHLQSELIHNKNEHDVRLVYLAIAAILKNRGNFLLSNVTSNGKVSVSECFDNFKNAAEVVGLMFESLNETDVLPILNHKSLNSKDKVKKLCEIGGFKAASPEGESVKLLVGMKANAKKIFVLAEGLEDIKLQISSDEYSALAEEIGSLVDTTAADFLNSVKMLADTVALEKFMSVCDYIADVKMLQYNEHKADKTLLKNVLRKYNPKAYDYIFNGTGIDTYSAYVGVVSHEGEKTTVRDGSNEAFFKRVMKDLEEADQNDPDVKTILFKAENGTLLPKLRTADNRVFPNQLYVAELKAILTNAENYLTFLKEKDESGLSVSEEIISMASFKIPYFVGPLKHFIDENGETTNAWFVPKEKSSETGPIRPWNIEERIDMHKTAEAFINNLVGNCTYLVEYKCIPSDDPLYSKFKILNEINSIKINEEPIPVKLKQEIYNTLYAGGKKCSFDKLIRFLIKKGYLKDKEDSLLISGIDKKFSNQLTAEAKLKNLIDLNAEDANEILTDIVYLSNIYGDSKKYFKDALEKKHPGRFDEKTLNRIANVSFSGWGELSREFLMLEGASTEDGVIRTVIDALWETNDNLMQLLSSRYTYAEELMALNPVRFADIKAITSKDLDALYLNNTQKKMLLQSLKIINEHIEEFGHGPERLFIEAYEEDDKRLNTKSRKSTLMELFNGLGKEERAYWRNKLSEYSENELKNRKLYLWFMQLGKCMFSGEDITEAELKAPHFNIDHIWPKHYIKDNSIHNNLVLCRSTINRDKKDGLVPLKMQEEQSEYWLKLLKCGLMSVGKYSRLTRKEAFTDTEKAAFIQSHLDDKRRVTKALRTVLCEALPETEVIAAKTADVEDFRNKFKLYENKYAQYSYAFDAYLATVVGNCYHVKFTKDPINFIRDAVRYPKNPLYTYNMERLFDFNIIRNDDVAWICDRKSGTLAMINEMLLKHPMVSRQAAEINGSITRKITLWPAEVCKPDVYLPIKSDPRLDVSKYGGLVDIRTSTMALIEYTSKKGEKERSLEAIPVILGKEPTDEQIAKKCAAQLKIPAENIRVIIRSIPLKSRVKIDGCYYFLGGKSGNVIALDFASFLNIKDTFYLAKIRNAVARDNFEETMIVSPKNKLRVPVLSAEKNIKMYDCILNKYQSGMYANSFGIVSKIITAKREDFIKLPIKEQCIVLDNLLMYSYGKTRSCDLSLLGESVHAGSLGVPKVITKRREFILYTSTPCCTHSDAVDLLTFRA
ncbi:MAG: type II CRISPR RNA-guided endonuclease Cas9 [Eubacteriales bacterium]|nr:type II CRISPR RNA-guided endonuclease Cas9 [Eubacteriales bacterium]